MMLLLYLSLDLLEKYNYNHHLNINNKALIIPNIPYRYILFILLNHYFYLNNKPV